MCANCVINLMKTKLHLLLTQLILFWHFSNPQQRMQNTFFCKPNIILSMQPINGKHGLGVGTVIYWKGMERKLQGNTDTN